MSHGNANGRGAGAGAGAVAEESEFDLPDEILAVMPTNPYEQLDLARNCLETFKRQLMQSLSEDNVSKQQETVESRICDQSFARASLLKDEIFMGGPATLPKSTSTENTTQDTGQRLSITQLPSRSTQTSIPKVASAVTPKGVSTKATPKFTSGTTSPTKTQFEDVISMSPWYPSSKQSSTSSSPRRHSITGFPKKSYMLSGSTPRVDGKEFFRQARSCLSYEQFGAFLANIKELNAHKQSREETLKKAEEIFGTDNKDLYISFQGLLKCNMQ